MTPTITFFPVDNGDMTLISLGDSSDTKILIDCNIRQAADNPDDVTRDVAADLRKRIKLDEKGRPYVDVFVLSHPDVDHCRGLARHFYLGAPADYPDDRKPTSEKRIIIREIWSSPMIFRRACKEHVLSSDAIDFNREAKRRVKVNRESGFNVVGGNRILILGEDEDGKTDDLQPILVYVDDLITEINASTSLRFAARLLAPLPKTDEGIEEVLGKNHSSVILNIELTPDDLSSETFSFLTGGDAEVAIWEMLWNKHEDDPSVLEYDLMQTPHHCSWHALSYDSWSELHNRAEVSEAARFALGQSRNGAKIVSSSCAIRDDDNDPPCYGAKRIYESIASVANGKFYCTGEYPSTAAVEPLEFVLTDKGFEVRPLTMAASRASLLRNPVTSTGLSFPNKPLVPNKPQGFA
jgi:hypothetical protein